MASYFYDQAKLLDPSKETTNPTLEQIELVSSMIADEKFARYFFDHLENHVWAPILEQRGYYLNAPEPIEVEQDSFRIPTWPAAIYLRKVARSVPDTVISIIKNIETNNSRVQELLLESLAEVPSEDAIQVREKISGWLDTRFTDFLPIKYGVLIEKWLSEGFALMAIQLFEELITPILPSVEIKPKNFYHPPLRFRSDHYWIKEEVQKHFTALLNADFENVVNAYDRQVNRYIELTKNIVGSEVELYTGFRWRYDIPFHASSSNDLDPYDALVDGLRDALIVLCEKKPKVGREKLFSYITNEHVIFQRLGIFALRRNGQEYPDLLEKVIANRNYLENKYFHSDYKGLIKDQFGNVSVKNRKKVVDWILEGPLDVDVRALNHAKWQNRNVEDTDKQIVIERWQLENLAPISNYLPEKSKNIYDGIVAKYGEPDIEERPRISTSVSWGTTSSPISADDLAKMSFSDLFDLLLTYVSSDTFEDSIENLARTFGSVVKSDPVKYRDFARHLIDLNIKYEYVYNYLNGVSEAIKDNKEKLSGEVIALCESVVEKKEDSIGASDPYEAGLLTAQLEVARLLENALRSDDPYLTGNLLERIKKILFVLSEHPDPLPKNEGGSFDPFTQSLNCVRGVAMHALIHYLLYMDRQKRKLLGKESYKPTLDASVRDVLQKKLDKSNDPSLAVHSIFGAYLPQLQHLDREWVKKNIEKIFPEFESQAKYWQASWDAYILSSNVYGDVFTLLVDHYQRGLRMLSKPMINERPWGSPDERLAQHIMFLYINDLTDFGHENNLFDLFFSSASDEIRSRAIFWLSKALENSKPSAEDNLWIRLWKLWHIRIGVAIASDEPANFRNEVSDYMRWLENSPVDLGFLNDILQQSIVFLVDGYSVQLMGSFAAKHCENNPLEAVSLIYEAIRSAKEPWWSPEVKDEEAILRAAIMSGNSDAKDVAVELINYRGEQGDFHWKDLLE